jgi:Tfp pilus assembly protein PilF
VTAAEEASRAVDAEPWAAEPRVQLALAEERRGDLPAALSAIRGANDRALWNGSDWLIRARVEARLGRLTEAAHAMESARALTPYSPIFSVTGFE